MSDNKKWSPPSEAELSALPPLGRWLERSRVPARAAGWKKALFGVLAVLALANFGLRPHEAHFGPDALPLFWPVFGLVAGVVMVFLLKKVLQPWFLKRPEDYYGDL
jgi:antibiotic biosynthesis monooxygenase (ABM) superfamily enzyme